MNQKVNDLKPDDRKAMVHLLHQLGRATPRNREKPPGYAGEHIAHEASSLNRAVRNNGGLAIVDATNQVDPSFTLSITRGMSPEEIQFALSACLKAFERFSPTVPERPLAYS